MKPKFYRGRPIIQPGETYLLDGIAYIVVTATAGIIGSSGARITLSNPEFTLENTATSERLYMRESDLQAKFKEES